MFTNKDIEFRSIYVINCIEQRNLRVSNGEVLLEEQQQNKEKKTLTKLPFQKILALFVIGHITVTTPLIEKCHQNGVALVVMKQNLRPVFFESRSAEANYLLRQRQYHYPTDDIRVAKALMRSKFSNQLKLLHNTRKRDNLTTEAIQQCNNALIQLPATTSYDTLMGLEGVVARCFFKAYYQQIDWHQRAPRTKCDALNATLDIGYTILFNFIEVFARMFGFDVYIGVYHRLWFKRKSLVCDLVEPFRCIIDAQTRKAFNLGQFKEADFSIIKNEYRLKFERNGEYCKIFYTALIDKKQEIFSFIRDYYRCFMQNKEFESYPTFQY